MTPDKTPSDALAPCPFCGAGETQIHVNKGTWRGHGYGEPVSVEVRHWCANVPGQPSRMISRAGRDEASAIAAWNTRAKWSSPVVATKISIPTNAMEQEFQNHYRRGFEAGKKDGSPVVAGVPVAWKEYAQHLEWCRTCAEDAVGTCHEGSSLKVSAMSATPQPPHAQDGASDTSSKTRMLAMVTAWLDSLGAGIHTYSLRGIALAGFEKGWDAHLQAGAVPLTDNELVRRSRVGAIQTDDSGKVVMWPAYYRSQMEVRFKFGWREAERHHGIKEGGQHAAN